MTTVLAIFALVSLPLLLDLHFNAPRGSYHDEEEYIPDGR